MRRREMLLTTGALGLGLAAFPRGWVAAEDKPKRRVLFFTRSAGFEHSVIHRKGDELGHAEKIFIDLGQQHGFEVNATKDGRVFDSDLDQYDAFFFYTTGDLTKPSRDGGEPMSPQGKERFMAAVAAGKGFIASHCGSDTFHSEGPARERQTNPEPYIAMLGGEFISHGAQQPAKQIVVDPKFPGVGKLGESFEIHDEWYSLKNLAEDMHVVLLMSTEGMKGRDYERPNFPSTWARMQGKGRVFYTSMGHREDVWTSPVFHDVLLGGLSWAVGNVDADVTPNLAKVAPDAQKLENA